MLTLFSTSELCGTGERSKSTTFHSKGRSREFLGTFFGKKVPAVARHEGRQGCVEKALSTKFTFNKTQNSRYLSYTDPVIQLLNLLIKEELSSGEMRSRLGIKHRQTFRDMHPALEKGLIIQTIPDKPNSRLQKYKLTERAKNT
ncbi:MAG TPA: hypothetical protein VL125_08775 [Pelobium sp.]|nr:hypothetical protein [Pelobium sp.]